MLLVFIYLFFSFVQSDLSILLFLKILHFFFCCITFWKTTILAIILLRSVDLFSISLQKCQFSAENKNTITFDFLHSKHVLLRFEHQPIDFFFLFCFYFWNIKYVCVLLFLFLPSFLISSQQVPCSNDSNINVFIWKYSLHFNTLTFLNMYIYSIFCCCCCFF